MTEEDIVIKLAVLEQESKSAKHRLDDLEIQNQAIQDLALAVKELTINMGNMLTEQKKQGDRLCTLEQEPAQHWNNAKQTVINTIIGAIAGAFASGVVYMVAQYIR